MNGHNGIGFDLLLKEEKYINADQRYIDEYSDIYCADIPSVQIKNQGLKRYVAEISVYIYATSDTEAINEAFKIAHSLNDDSDCDACLTNLVEQPFGTLYNRTIKFNQL